MHHTLLSDTSGAAPRRTHSHGPLTRGRPVTRGRRRRSLVVATALMLAATSLVAAGGCKKAQVLETTGETGEGGGSLIDKLDGREFYLQFVHLELDNACGAICHGSNATCVPQFMAKTAEGSYKVLSTYVGAVTHADNSNLIYHGAHTGPALTEFQEGLIRQWLTKEFEGETPPSPTLAEALVEVGGCMQEQEFDDDKVYLLAYNQSDQGPCGSCHRTGEAGTWIGFNKQEMFDKNTRLPWIKRLIKPAYDGNNLFNDLVPSNRFVDKVESVQACGSPHASGNITVENANAVDVFVTASLERWRTGACDP